MNKRDAKRQEAEVRRMLRDDQFCQDHIDWYEKAGEVGSVDILLYVTANELLTMRRKSHDLEIERKSGRKGVSRSAKGR